MTKQDVNDNKYL